MKRIIVSLSAILMLTALNGQHLITGPVDNVITGSYPYDPMLVQADPAHFYWTGAMYNNSVMHPMLTGLTDTDTHKSHFIWYDKDGKALGASYISGAYIVRNAFAGAGGLIVTGRCNQDIQSEGTVVPINNASRQEFIASYTRNLILKNLVGVWNLDQSQYPSSVSAFEEVSGNIYLAGTGYVPLRLADGTMIGENQDYLYVLKYNSDLVLTGMYTAGFVAGGEYGYYDELVITPHPNGSVLITGTYEGDRAPLFKEQQLPALPDDYGVFGVLLDPGMNEIWVKGGNSGPRTSYATGGFKKGFAMRDGGFVLGGSSSKGYFDFAGKTIIEGWAEYDERNLFACRLSPGGDYGTNIGFDFLSWRNNILYVTGIFQNDALEIAGRSMNKPFYYGAFVAAVDMDDGEEIWGYSLSSDDLGLYGFDHDAAGSVCLMGRTASNQEFEGIGPSNVPGKNPVFILGLDVGGSPVWYNNSYLQNINYGLNGADLEVLPGGEVFVSMNKTDASALYIGGSDLFVDYNYSNWMVGLVANNSLEGDVIDQDGNPVNSGTVKLYKASSKGRGAYPAVDSVDIDASGHYRFDGIYPGHYTLLAIPDRANNSDALPCYYGGKAAWTDAWFMDVVVNKEETEVDIEILIVPELEVGDGNGQISGTITYEEEGAGKKHIDAKPVIRSTVILKKKSSSQKKGTHAGDEDIVAYGETDETGLYFFDNVPDGDYLLIVDITGLDMIETHEVSISGNQLTMEGKDYTVSDQGIYTWTGVGYRAPEREVARIWPNPGSGMLNVEYPSSSYEVDVFNLSGQEVLSRKMDNMEGSAVLDMSHLESGMYLLRFSGPDGQSHIKYLKQ